MFAKFKESCRTSFWLLPGLMGTGAILFALGLIYLERNVFDFLPISWIKNVNVMNLSTTLSTLLGAIVTVFGILLPLTFSIILRASNQFTPMVLRIYRLALSPKLFLGLMFATTLYLIVLLISLNHLDSPTIPWIAILIGFILIILTIYFIPAFFDRFITSLEPSYFASVITEDLKEMLKKYELHEGDKSLDVRQDRSKLTDEQFRQQIQASKSGYIQSIDTDQLISICQREECFMTVPVRPGIFILEGNALVNVKKDKKIGDNLAREITSCFVLGKKRLGIADLELQLDELASIVHRALSPGVTDLSTALECINQVGVVCNLLLNRSLHSGVHYDEKGVERVFTKEFDFFGFVHSAFDTIRQNINGQPSVAIHLLGVIENLVENCIDKDRARVLLEIASEIIMDIKEESNAHDATTMQKSLEKIEVNVNRKGMLW